MQCLDVPVRTIVLSQMVEAHAFKPRTRETEAGKALSSGQPSLQSEFQDSQGYLGGPCQGGNKKSHYSLLVTRDTMTKEILMKKKAFIWGLAYSFRGLVHDHHGREHSGPWPWNSS